MPGGGGAWSVFMAPLFRSGVLGEHVFDLGQSGQELRLSVSALCRLSALSLFSSG